MVRLLALGVVLLALAVPIRATTPKTADAKAAHDKERLKTFDWMDGLGYGDARKMPFVRVQTGNWMRRNNEQSRYGLAWGFLLRDNGKKFSILDMNFQVRDFERTGPNTPLLDQVEHKPSPLKAHAAAVLAGKAEPDLNPEIEYSEQHGRALSWRRCLVLAWACSRQGLADQAAKLYAQAQAATDEREVYYYRRPISLNDIGSSASERGQPLKKRLAENLFAAELSQTLQEFCAPDGSRRSLLFHAERICQRYPDASRPDWLKTMMSSLVQMIREDEQHDAAWKKQGQPLDKLSKKEQIDELIFRLRDATDAESPSPELAAIGYDAVPQLIEAMADTRLARFSSLRLFGRGSPSGSPTGTVGECADAVISQIAGKSFHRYPTVPGVDERTSRKAAIRVWFEELRVKGEKKWLIDAVSRGDDESVEVGSRLVQRFPKEALPPLIAGMRNAGESSSAAYLMSLVGSLESPEALGWMKTQVLDGPVIAIRLAAARALTERNQPEGLAAMIAEWRGQRRLKQDLPLLGIVAAMNGNFLTLGGLAAFTRIPDDSSEVDALAQFLITSSKPEAIEAIAESLPKRPLQVRFNVLWNMAHSGISEVFAVPEPQDPDSVRMRKAAQAIFDGEFTDREVYPGFSMSSSNGVSFSSPRLCDLAGYVANSVAPHRYDFNIMASLRERNRRLIEVRNSWRLANKLPPLPVPEFPTVAMIPDHQVRPLLDKLQAAPAARRPALQAMVEKLGPAAFLAVLNQRDRAANKEDADYFDNLAKRLASTVTSIEFSENSVRPDAKLIRPLDDLKGKPLDPATLWPALANYAKDVSARCDRFTVSAHRSGDGTGFTLTVELTGKNQTPKSSKAAKLFASQILKRGSDTFSRDHELVTKDAATKDLGKGLGNLLLRAAPGEAIEVLIELHEVRDQGVSPGYNLLLPRP